MIISEGQAKAINALLPGNLNTRLGDVLRAMGQKTEMPAEDPQALIHLTYEIVSDLTGGLDAIECPCDLEILDVIVQCRASIGGGGVMVRKGTSWISSTVVMESNKAIERTLQVDDAYSSFTKGQYINLVAETSGDRGLVTIVARRI